ncbi:MAG: YdcF family protein [Rickettsiales bacterium]|nr:YdcF family protein [Rickettsiales bacterium]
MRLNRKFFVYCFLICTTISKLLGIGFLFFLSAVPTNLPLNQKIDTDAIVVLTGGQKRIETGVYLLRKNPSKMLFISGVNPKIQEIPEVMRVSALLPNTSRNRIKFGQKARSTFENALETKAWLESNRVKSITLVTAAYHIPRSILEFKKTMPNIRVESYPVFPKGFKVDKWWLSPRSIIFLLKEYLKCSIVYSRIYLKSFYEKRIKNT